MILIAMVSMFLFTMARVNPYQLFQLQLRNNLSNIIYRRPSYNVTLNLAFPNQLFTIVGHANPLWLVLMPKKGLLYGQE